jgi:glyceraldehyde 3-phosphate dehydrogenase
LAELEGTFSRALARSAFADIEIVGINDLTDVKTITHLVKYDSIVSRADQQVTAGKQRDGRVFPSPVIIVSRDTQASLGAEYVQVPDFL